MGRKKPNKMNLTLDRLINRCLEATQAKKEEERNYLGMSYLGGECERRVYYMWRNYRLHKFSGFLLKRFREGNEIEPRICDYLRLAGFEVREINERARNPLKQFRGEWLGGLVSGGVDGFIKNKQFFGDDEWRLLEIKMMVSSKYIKGDRGTPLEDVIIGNKYKGSIGRYEEEGEPDYIQHVEKKKPQFEGRYFKTMRQGAKVAQRTHYAQMQNYMGVSAEMAGNGKFTWQNWGLPQPLTQGLYVIVSTDMSQIACERIYFEQPWWDASKGRAMRLFRATEPPARLSEDPTCFDCAWCDFKRICHGNEAPSKTCMSCEHMETKVPGDKGFFGKRGIHACKKRGSVVDDFEACEQYSVIPQRDELKEAL